MKNDPACLVVDLGLAPYMDSCGLGTHIETLQITPCKKTRLTVCNLSTRVRSVFELSRLTTVLTVVDNNAQALLA